MNSIHKILIIVIVLVSNSLFAQTNYGLNQSYFLTDDGNVHTVRSYMPDETLVKLFSPNGFFILPEKIELSKSSYLLDTDKKLYTVDTNGFFYQYDYDSRIDSEIKHAGQSFFMTRNKSLHIILTNGTIKTLDKDDYDLDSKIKEVGGNYLITRKNTVYMINPFDGSISNTGLEIKRRDILALGDNFLITSEGIIYSFGLMPDGGKVIKSIQSSRFETIQKVAGNYFIAANGNIVTIATNGEIYSGVNFRGFSLGKRPVMYGANYFVLNDNSFYIVDQDGIFHMLEKFDKRIIHTTK